MSAPTPEQSMGPETTRFARIDPGPSFGVNPVATAAALVGILLVLASFLALDWFDADHGAGLTFSDTHRLLGDAGPVAHGLASAFFGWLGFALMVVTFMLSVAATMPGIGRPFRLLAPLAAAVSIIVTFLAIDLFGSTTDTFVKTSYGDYLGNATVGFWLAVAGFAVMGVAGAVGPRRLAR